MNPSTTAPAAPAADAPARAETATSPRAAGPLPRRHLYLAILAMALCSFAIGTTEFASMGLLPQIAADLDVSIPQAGMLITLYALGVVVGAPLVTVAAARVPRVRLLILLAGVVAAGNLLSAVAPTFSLLAISRVLAGLPHGAFFGVAALVASKLAPPHQRAKAVSFVMLGLTVATMVGVPASTAFGQAVGWRSAYVLVVAFALASVLAIWRIVPEPDGLTVTGSARGELRALRRVQVWFALGVGAIGFGGMFAVYSYIGEVVPGVMGLPITAVPIALLVFGCGMTAGNLLAGVLADRSVYGTIALGLIGMAAALAAFAMVAQNAAAGFVMLFLVATASQLMGPALQIFLLDASPDAPSLAAALQHSALNIGNALGAALGAAVLAAGWGLLAPSWVGVGLALLGLVILGGSYMVSRRQQAPTQH